MMNLLLLKKNYWINNNDATISNILWYAMVVIGVSIIVLALKYRLRLRKSF